MTNNHSHKIAMLICYFGKEPWYFRMYAESCSHNPTVDFILVTDIDFSCEVPPNMIIVKRTIEEVRIMASEKLAFPVCLSHPYKFCDLKPAYGLLFSELLEPYDFWGHGDIDVIYGNIRKFITDEMLNYFELISVKKEYVCGFFTLFKNTERMNNLFKLSKDYRKVFQDPDNYCFDECNWQTLALSKGHTIFQVPQEIESMTYIVKRLSFCGELRAYFETLVAEEPVGLIQWNNGAVLYDNRVEVLLFHFIAFKELPFFHVPGWKQIPSVFYVHSFFISTWAPGTLPALLKRWSLLAWKVFYLKGKSCVQYFAWLLKYIGASQQIKPGQGVEISGLVGEYRESDFLAVTLAAENGALYVKWQGDTVARLLHRDSNRFLIDRFLLAKSINIDVELHYDEWRKVPTLHIKPYAKGRTILYKVN